MPKWTNQEFETKAADLAHTYWAGVGQNGSSLTDLVTKTARDQNLNPEQIERLCRRTNLLAYEQKFGALKGEANRNVEFPVASAHEVLAGLAPSEDTNPIPKAASYPDLPDELSVARGLPQLPMEKVASIQDHLNSIERSVGKELPLPVRYQRLLKAAGQIDVEIARTKQIWKTAMEDVAGTCRQIYWDHDAFEKAALALLDDPLPELNAIRKEMKKEALVLNNEKLAALKDRLVANPSRETSLMKVAIQARHDHLEFLKARDLTQHQLTSTKEILRVGH